MYLLDTVILSELRKSAARRDVNVIAWLTTIEPKSLFLSTVTIAEVERGIELQTDRNPAFANDLAQWLEVIVRVYGERILPLTLAVARRWGRLSARLGNMGMDLAIAATALEHGLSVATRNVGHFEPTGVTVVNPFVPPRG